MMVYPDPVIDIEHNTLQPYFLCYQASYIQNRGSVFSNNWTFDSEIINSYSKV